MICPKCSREIPDDARLCCYCGRTIVKLPRARKHQRSNGSGSVYKRGKTWTLQITVGWDRDASGKPRQRCKYKGGFKTKNDALDYLPEFKRNYDAALKRVPTLGEYWDSYFEHEYERLSESKKTAYRIAWRKLSALHFLPVDAITVQDLRNVVDKSASSYYTARDMKVVLSHLFKLASADGWVRRDLPDFIILPPLKEKERSPFSPDEQRALWRVYDEGDRRAALPLIMIYTGMMPGEMQNLKVEMVDFDAQQITGAGLKTDVRKKSPIYLPDDIVPVLYDEIQASTSQSGYVWARNEDKFYKNYYAALEAAGCRRLEPYCCRHTTATALAITENIAPRTIQKVMRWSSTRMLDRYAHPDDKDALDAINTLKRSETRPAKGP